MVNSFEPLNQRDWNQLFLIRKVWCEETVEFMWGNCWKKKILLNVGIWSDGIRSWKIYTLIERNTFHRMKGNLFSASRVTSEILTLSNNADLAFPAAKYYNHLTAFVGHCIGDAALLCQYSALDANPIRWTIEHIQTRNSKCWNCMRR